MRDKVKCLFSAEKEPTAATSSHPSTMLALCDSVVAMHHIYHTGGKESGFKMKELASLSLSSVV